MNSISKPFLTFYVFGACLFTILLYSSALSAREWNVGPTQTYTKPSHVSGLIADGDTVSIDAGVYASDATRWTANNILIRGVGGYADLSSHGVVYGSKAIWVIAGNNVRVRNIIFRDAACPDKNGAGIRAEGHDLDVAWCQFIGNEDGILAGAVHPSTMRIRHCEFARNGYGDGYSHNLYIGAIDSLIFEYNYSHHCRSGHELKSRAAVNIIHCNRLSNELDGTASRNIDLPNGGTAVITSNIIEQGPQTENSNMIGYGLEGYVDQSASIHRNLILVNNTIVNDRSGGSFIQVSTGCDSVLLVNNILAGNATLPASVSPGFLIAHHNLTSTVSSSIRFTDQSNYDYRLLSSSPAIDAGTESLELSVDTSLLRSVYVHPFNSESRCRSANRDIGAYELCVTSEVRADIDLLNRTYRQEGRRLVFATAQRDLTVYTLLGQCLYHCSKCDYCDLPSSSAGVVLIHADTESIVVIP